MPELIISAIFPEPDFAGRCQTLKREMRHGKSGRVCGLQNLKVNLMKIHASIAALLVLCASSIPLLLTGCDSRSGPGPEIHDNKYVALDASGQQLAAGEPGPCVLDQFTGLIWEVKTDTPGLHSAENTYSWFDPNEDASGELDYRGKPDGGECSGSACDTGAFVFAVNAGGYCGFNDWRMPTRDELGSISDPRKTRSPPTINVRYFPHTRSGEYWSGNDYQFHWDTAWLWNFENGLDRVEWKSSPRYVRLVRGEPLYLERVED